uniref:Uncharacterized protein n=1 Tax=Opuntia streptacantha TaxID=393608 RepID=A0A7C8YNZ5_OPUST
MTNCLYDTRSTSFGGMNYLLVVLCMLCMPCQQFFLRITDHNTIYTLNSEQLSIISRITTHKGVERHFTISFKFLHQVHQSLSFTSSLWQYIQGSPPTVNNFKI